jgi:hypothetical protein
MQKNKIYLSNRLSDYDKDLLKKDCISNFVELIYKAKKSVFDKSEVESIARIAVEEVFSDEASLNGKMLQDVIKMHLFKILDVECAKKYQLRKQKIKRLTKSIKIKTKILNSLKKINDSLLKETIRKEVNRNG